jgi:hypothetical protein
MDRAVKATARVKRSGDLESVEAAILQLQYAVDALEGFPMLVVEPHYYWEMRGELIDLKNRRTELKRGKEIKI